MKVSQADPFRPFAQVILVRFKKQHNNKKAPKTSIKQVMEPSVWLPEKPADVISSSLFLLLEFLQWPEAMVCFSAAARWALPVWSIFFV